MDDPSVERVKSISRGIRRVPFGITALDGRFDGIPTGSAVLLAGAKDSGIDAFTKTSVAELMLAKHRPDMHAGRVRDQRAHIPDAVTYVSLTDAREHVYDQFDSVLDTYQFETLAEHLTVADFSQQFLEASPVPDPLRQSKRSDTLVETDEETRDAFAGVSEVLDNVSDLVASAGPESVVVVDSLTALFRATRYDLDRGTVLAFLMGLHEAATEWNSLVYVLDKRRAADVRADADLGDLFQGSVYFYSNDQGFQTYRTMRVGSFGGALDRENQLVYETFVGPAGLRAKATKKIPPRNW